MVSHIGSICENCGSDQYKHVDQGLTKRQILASTCFTSAALIVLSLFIGVFISAILVLVTLAFGITLAVKANPKTISFCKKCKSKGTMHFVGSPKGKELYEKYYKDK